MAETILEQQPIGYNNSYNDETLAGKFTYIFNQKELMRHGETTAQRYEHTRKYFLDLGIDIDEIPIPDELKNLQTPVVGRWRQIHTGNLETIITTKVLKELGIDYIDLCFAIDHYSEQSEDKKRLVEPRIYTRGNKPHFNRIAHANERQILENIKTMDGQHLTEYHQDAYEKITGKKPVDVSETFSQYLAQYLINTDKRPTVWIVGQKGLAHRLEWDEKQKYYTLKHVEGLENYLFKKSDGDGIPIELEKVIRFAENNKARGDGNFNYEFIYPAILGTVPFVPLVTPWEQDKGGVQLFAKTLQESSKKITGECIPTMPFHNIDTYVPKSIKKLFGGKPSLTLVDVEGEIIESNMIPKNGNVYNSSEELVNNIIEREQTKRKKALRRKKEACGQLCLIAEK